MSPIYMILQIFMYGVLRTRFEDFFGPRSPGGMISDNPYHLLIVSESSYSLEDDAHIIRCVLSRDSKMCKIVLNTGLSGHNEGRIGSGAETQIVYLIRCRLGATIGAGWSANVVRMRFDFATTHPCEHGPEHPWID